MKIRRTYLLLNFYTRHGPLTPLYIRIRGLWHNKISYATHYAPASRSVRSSAGQCAHVPILLLSGRVRAELPSDKWNVWAGIENPCRTPRWKRYFIRHVYIIQYIYVQRMYTKYWLKITIRVVRRGYRTDQAGASTKTGKESTELSTDAWATAI